jgi:hypothetical protein
MNGSNWAKVKVFSDGGVVAKKDVMCLVTRECTYLAPRTLPPVREADLGEAIERGRIGMGVYHRGKRPTIPNIK